MALQPIPQHDGVERERGAVPDSAMYYGNMGGGGSRRFNPVEYAAETQRIIDAMETRVAQAHEAAGVEFLVFFRGLLKAHTFTNHQVYISAGMGCASVYVRDLRTDDKYPVSDLVGARGVYQLLQEIDQALDWDWAGYLNDKVLAGPGV